MSVTSKNPLRMAGANLNSGQVNTGDIYFTQGGAQKYTAFSGGLLNLASGGQNPPAGAPAVVADNALLFSGAGRLNKCFPHQLISGVSVVFYDASVPALSGPNNFTKSGYAVLGILPANTIGGIGVNLGAGPFVAEFGIPFNSGLCVSATSGCPGFTVSWTPETNPSTGVG